MCDCGLIPTFACSNIYCKATIIDFMQNIRFVYNIGSDNFFYPKEINNSSLAAQVAFGVGASKVDTISMAGPIYYPRIQKICDCVGAAQTDIEM